MHAMAGTGRVIAGRYRLKEPIGRGAMGTVWRAWDEILDREVAVKELRISDGLPPDERAKAYQRTHREARTAARLSHPGVVTVFDVAEEDGRPWIIMELVAAHSLDQIIAHDGPLPPHRAAHAAASCWPPWPPRTRPACCTATLSRATCCSATAAGPYSPTSASRPSRETRS